MSSQIIPWTVAKHVAFAAMTAFALATPFGCSQGDGRRAVGGTVTVDGQPLAVGLINFQPVEGARAASAGTSIEQGKFELPAKRGLLPGKYRVLIQAFRETGRTIDDPQRGKVSETVSIRFKRTGALEAVVAEEGPNRFDFELTSVP